MLIEGLILENLSTVLIEVLKNFERRVSKVSFDLWFKDVQFVVLENNLMIIRVNTNQAKEWISNHYVDDFVEYFFALTGEQYQFKFVTPQELEVAQISFEIDQTVHDDDRIEYGMLLEKYTFDRFVVGHGNLFAHAACFAVAADPGNAYNPLFIYGGSGLGKTHLLQAIGHSVREKKPNYKVVYLSSEKFTNEFIRSISENRSEEFRQKYRQVDVLLIDDIQFLAKKTGTQEEFFHTFNTLYELGKQIVISSDRPPIEIQTLEDRLRSRFGWGLITDITAPDLETRVAILQKKAKSDGLVLSNDVMIYIANSIDTNVRELEGALTRVLAYSSLLNKEIDINLTEEALKNLLPNSPSKEINIFDIQKVVGSHYNVKMEDFKSKSRSKSVAFPRQIAMFLSRELIGISFPKIGEEFGGRDHSTVMHACEKISVQMKEDTFLRNQIDNIKRNLKS